MNTPIVFRYLGIILMTIALCFVFCFALYVCFDLDSTTEYYDEWALSIAITFILGLSLIYLSRGASQHIYRREALAIIGLGWVLSCIIGALPYALIMPNLSFGDVLFESTSGITTTGASILARPSELPMSLQLWRSLSQWVGGLGVVLFFVAILSFVGAGAKMLYSNESSGESADLDSPRIQKSLIRIFVLYFVLTAACFGLLKWEGMSYFNALCHAFTTVATGGFSTMDNSIAGFNSAAIEYTIIAFMILGGLSFLFMLDVIDGKLQRARKNLEWKAYIFIISFMSVAITLATQEAFNCPIHDCFRMALFQVTSIITTTGFATTDYDLLVPVVHVLLMILMLTGACSGSTAGGVKLIRVLAMLRISVFQIEKSFRPRLVKELRVGRKILSDGLQASILAYILLATGLTLASMAFIAMIENNLSFEGTVSTTVACLFNIGPGFAEVGPAKNFGFFKDGTKIFLSLLMILGRLEFFALLALFSPAFWRRFS